jgi:hypothetical protein
MELFTTASWDFILWTLHLIFNTYIENIAAKSNTNIQKCIQKSYDDANVMTNETAPKEMT